MPKQKKPRDVDKMTGQKNNNYEVIDSSNPGGKESYGEEPPCYACDRKRCLNGRCGVCWLVILGVAFAVGICSVLIIFGALGFSFSTDGNETLYELICDDCTFEPTSDPTSTPTTDPTPMPTVEPTATPTDEPTATPTVEPTSAPTGSPTVEPTGVPSVEPTLVPTDSPSVEPTAAPTGEPTLEPSGVPSVEPTKAPTADPTVEPTSAPTSPTYEPTAAPTGEPTLEPTADPTVPTNEPTSAPTSEPTSERRMYKSEMTPNVLLIVLNGIGNAEFETPKMNEFFQEGYTFNNINEKFSWSSLIAGRLQFDKKTATFVEHLGSKGYKNYYYGNWLKSAGGTWDSNKVINNSEDLVLEEVQSDIWMLNDEMWSITVALTKSDSRSRFRHHSNKTAVYDTCRHYFKAGSLDYDHSRGVSCQRSMTCDEKFGKVLETLRTTGLWEHTMVVLVTVGEQKNMFSIGGGSLPAKYFRRTNKDVHSFLNVVPTILALSGFSESELANLNLDGFPVISVNHGYAMSF